MCRGCVECKLPNLTIVNICAIMQAKRMPFLWVQEGQHFIYAVQISWRPSRALDSVTSSAYSN